MCILSWYRSPVQKRRSYGAATGPGAPQNGKEKEPDPGKTVCS